MRLRSYSRADRGTELNQARGLHNEREPDLRSGSRHCPTAAVAPSSAFRRGNDSESAQVGRAVRSARQHLLRRAFSARTDTSRIPRYRRTIWKRVCRISAKLHADEWEKRNRRVGLLASRLYLGCRTRAQHFDSQPRQFMMPRVRSRDPQAKGGPDFLSCYRTWQGNEQSVIFESEPGIETIRKFSPTDYVGWDISVPDQYRDFIIKELKQFEEKKELPQLIIICLPNDHTSGTSANCPTPAACRRITTWHSGTS